MERNLKPMENMAANQENVYVHRSKSLYAVMPPLIDNRIMSGGLEH